MANRLGRATSTYLLQHADNPIDWWEWSDEAFAEARRRDVPILLSIGYAACHWCHVMAHESFSDVNTAAQVNAQFVAIKVDRAERPDVDAVYMAATQAMTGRGGWPMTCFLTPEGEPFHCGTYYPASAHLGVPSFRQVLTAATTAWACDREHVLHVAKQITTSLERMTAPDGPAHVDHLVLAEAAESLFSEFDAINGGFGAAPKFPPALCLEFLLRHHERTGSRRALHIVELTCDRMARGGLYDQLVGGFARYTVDAAWVVPHFEKMLNDNAMLLRVYAHLARRTGSALAERVAVETAEFLLSDMTTSEGTFVSALDADIDGQEGLTYLWSPAQLIEVLGHNDGLWAAGVLEVSGIGNFERGLSTLQLPYDPDNSERWCTIRAKLRDARQRRPQPARDGNVVTAWNGMAAHALAEAGVSLGRRHWVEAAAKAVDFLLTEHMIGGRLSRSSQQGRPGAGPAILEDFAWLADALLALHQVTGDPSRLDVAVALLDLALERFANPEQPGVFFDTADDAAPLIHRPRNIVDNATPSGSAALADALLTASALTGPTHCGRYREVAEATVSAVGDIVGRHARFAGHWLATAEAMVNGPVQVAVAGITSDSRYDRLLKRARTRAPGGSVIVPGLPDAAGVPLLAGRSLIGDGPTAYVCRGSVCEVPVNAPDSLEAQLVGYHQGRYPAKQQ